MRGVLLVGAIALGTLACGGPPRVIPDEPTPSSLEEFKAAATRILDDARIPGAGIGLVRADRIEWVGGIGWADRDRRIPATADTHFRAGSISKSFVALGLVQLYEDGALDLDATVTSVVPEVRIDNPWADTSPVTIRHLLEHTAGFDDMHLNEVYVLDGTPDRPLDEVLQRNPASRRVRWRPGTRMSYSNPGYAIAGLVLERVSGKRYDEFIRERTLQPLGMTTTTFDGEPDADPVLAQGYDAPTGPPVVRRRIHLRPAGALITSAAELSRFVQMLLGWGEREGQYVVDPEYLSNMEWPRTTAASTAGVRAGYGSGIYSTITLPYHVFGHQGGIDGFLSTYGYSPSRDVGFVVLINTTHAPEVLTRLSSLAIRYLKGELAPPPKDSTPVSPDTLGRFQGYYHDASPRSALTNAVTFPTSGRSVRLDQGQLVMSSLLGPTERLVPVSEGVFRRDGDVMGALAFTTVDGAAVLAGANLFAEKRARWPIDLLRAVLVIALASVAIAPFVALRQWWRRWRGRGSSTHGLGTAWLVATVALVSLPALAATTPLPLLATPSGRAAAIYVVSLIYPLAALSLPGLTLLAATRGVTGAGRVFAVVVALSHLFLATYLAWWGLAGFKSWTY